MTPKGLQKGKATTPVESLSDDELAEVSGGKKGKFGGQKVAPQEAFGGSKPSGSPPSKRIVAQGADGSI